MNLFTMLCEKDAATERALELYVKISYFTFFYRFAE